MHWWVSGALMCLAICVSTTSLCTGDITPDMDTPRLKHPFSLLLSPLVFAPLTLVALHGQQMELCSIIPTIHIIGQVCPMYAMSPFL